MVARRFAVACTFLLSISSSACQETERNPNAPTGFAHVKTAEDDYEEARVARDGPAQLFFGVVKHETPPPGYAPDTTPATDDTERGRTKVKGKVPPNASKVLTVDVVASRKVIGRIEHIDDSAPTFISLAGGPDSPGLIWAAIVGPKGERLTQLYHQRYDASHDRELVKIGTPIPRVMRFGWGNAQDHNRPSRFVFVLPAATPGFLHPLDNEGKRVRLPPGVVGVKPVTSTDTTTEWSAWLVGWKGERGEGWSYDRGGQLEKLIDTKPRWTDVTLGRTASARWMIGILEDGQCEAVIAESFIGDHEAPVKRTAATCEEALTTLDAELAAEKAARTKAERDAAAARAAREAADRAEKYQREKAAYDRLVATNAAEEKARDAERPIIEEFKKLASAFDFAPACKVAQRLRPRTHIALFAERAGSIPNLRHEEEKCVAYRKDLTNDDRFLLDGAKRVLVDAQIAAKREADIQRPVGDWNPGSGPSGPSAADRLKATHEYMYGSGKASSCPFTDRSLCK